MSRAERIRFQRIARHFHNYQREFQALKEQEGEEEWRTLAVQALEENITLTEHTLELIRQKHGVKAERMTRDWLLEHIWVENEVLFPMALRMESENQ